MAPKMEVRLWGFTRCISGSRGFVDWCRHPDGMRQLYKGCDIGDICRCYRWYIATCLDFWWLGLFLVCTTEPLQGIQAAKLARRGNWNIVEETIWRDRDLEARSEIIPGHSLRLLSVLLFDISKPCSRLYPYPNSDPSNPWYNWSTSSDMALEIKKLGNASYELIHRIETWDFWV